MYSDAYRRATSTTGIGDKADESALLLATLDVQRELICAWSPDGVVQYCNAEYRDFFGYAQSVLGANLADLVEWPPGENVASHVRSIVEHDGAVVTLRRYHDARSVEWTDTGIRGVDGSLTAIVSIGRDVTAAMRVEGALRQSQQRLRAIFGQISDAVALLDRDLSVIESSPQHHTFLGYEPGFWRNRDPLQAVHPDDRAAAVNVLRSLMGPAGDEVIGEIRLLRPNGSATSVEVRGVNLLDDPEVQAIVLVFCDIEDRKAAERETIERQRALEASLRQRIGFVEEASHALRNPLHGMLGLSELLANSHLDTPLADAAWAILRQASTMRRIVDDMLDHALLEVGHLRIDMREIDLQHVVNDCTRLARSSVTTDLHIAGCEVPGHLRTVLGDADRVRQVLSNLLTNACAATPGGLVSVKVQEGAAPGAVRCSVIDDGAGVAADDIDRLFLPYERGAAADPSGVGLGLTIAKAAVEAMGGTIGAASRPAGGMCVWFELQLVTAPTPSNDGHALTTTLADPLRVLVVDDDPINLMLAGMQVERMGSVAIAVPSAASALEALQASQFDVALIDVQMPEMDGLELVRRIRAGQAEQPLLAVMTASATAADREAALAAGADLFVPKPATFNDVLAVLDHRRRSVASPN